MDLIVSRPGTRFFPVVLHRRLVGFAWGRSDTRMFSGRSLLLAFLCSVCTSVIFRFLLGEDLCSSLRGF